MNQTQLQQIQQLYNKIPKQVITKFTTRLSQYQISLNEIDIPTEMDQSQCNKLLKSLLQSNGVVNVENLYFQFLVGGKLLRGQLKSHIIRYEISSFEPLQNQSTINQEDWVSTLSLITNPLGNCYTVGLFSGVATFYNQNNQEILKTTIDEDAIKSIKTLADSKQNSYYIISGGLNEEIKIGNLVMKNNNNQAKYDQLSNQQFSGSILAIDTNPIDDGHFCAVGNKGILSIYQIPENFSSSEEAHNSKVQLNQKSIISVASQKIHTDAINSVNWITQDRIVTGSSDHTIQLIDVEKLRSIGSVLTKDSITTSIDYSTDRLLTSHQDGYIRLWDIRAPQTPTHTYKGHSKLISCVKFNTKSYLFASCSYDTAMKIWDYRSTFPIQNIGTHHDKIFSLIWKEEKQLIGGGSDKKVSVHTV